ncbi:hypothetical protein ILUMI_09600 [Ignelater luminosus]|uniref:Ankyrin repeat protein n=1 Tax=Ignelater luminosus TaxID=2038154 RepID=A0A8K0G9G9_IGNLU|nr:hypothetical protein ILUMI_09600 [Ignelater luminosus]
MLSEKDSVLPYLSTENYCEKFSEVNSSALFEAILKETSKESYDYNIMLRFCLNINNGDEIVLRLIQEGCDPNSKCLCIQKPSLLHIAISKSKLDVARELIKRGADVNARYILNITPLHVAAKKGDANAVRLLLRYGADVHLLNELNESALECAIWYFSTDVVDTLKHFYSNTELLVSAAKVTNSLGVTLTIEYLRAEKDLNHLSNDGLCNLIILSTLTEKRELFELFWNKVDHSRCFDALLHCKAVISYLQDAILPGGYRFHLYTTKFLELSSKDRQHLIYRYLRLGYKFNWKVIECLYKRFGFNEELKAVIHCDGYSQQTSFELCENLYLYFMFNISEPSTNTISYIFNYLFAYDITYDNDTFWRYSNALRLFSLPINAKKQLLEIINSLDRRSSKKISDLFNKVVTTPSLTELSRTKARDYIKQYYNIKRPYQFIEVVEKLNLPPLIEDIIMFKAPIYYY